MILPLLIALLQSANFTGLWKLDKQSSDLPYVFELVDEYTLKVEHYDDKLSLEIEFSVKGRTVKGQKESYLINGSAQTSKDVRGVQITRSVRSDGDKLLISSEKIFAGMLQLPTINELQEWSLSTDSKTLTITVSDINNPTSKQKRVFKKY
ncbi:MAG: hypothetical protein RMM17_04745 [Acidobacteriota bacterium]|nr:hypothetical protein [Blastocatellia bacterium]MDW8411972.1 hypothetical protein [Acidobacteriota bacterium]